MVRLLFLKVSVLLVVAVQFWTNDKQMAFYISKSINGLLNDNFTFILILHVEGSVQELCKKISMDNSCTVVVQQLYCLNTNLKGKK